MFVFPTEQLLYGLFYALIGVAVWTIPFGIAYYLYKRWRGEGPRSRN